MGDKAGQKKTEVAMAVLALNNVAAGQEIRVDYGDDYLPEFNTTAQPEVVAGIKTEETDIDMQSGIDASKSSGAAVGRPTVTLQSMDQAIDRSWNVGDRFQIETTAGPPQFFQVTRNRYGGEDVYNGDFKRIVIGG
jgi:hypothetical protein